MNAPSLKPIIIGFALIASIMAFFLYKKNIKEKEIEDVRAKIEQESKKEVGIEVSYASTKETFKAIRNKSYQLVDIRQPEEFELKHIESSISIPLSSINEEVHLIDQEKIIIIIDRGEGNEGKIFAAHLEKEGAIAKYLEGGIVKYAQEDYSLITKGNPTSNQDLAKVTTLNAQQIGEKIMDGELIAFVDTRQQYLYDQNHITSAINIPLEELERRKRELPTRRIIVYDDNPLRSFRAAVRLYDMGVLGAYNSLDEFQVLKRSFEQPHKEKPSENQ